MERFLIALDCTPNCIRIIQYMARVLKGTKNCEFALFHILPTASPDTLRMDEVQRIERIHSTRPDLDGYFWRMEDEKTMSHCFGQALEAFVTGGFPKEAVSAHFRVESGDRAAIILEKAAELGCATIVLGRRRLSRVKEFLLGSVSSTVLKASKSSAVWVVEN